MGALTEKSIRGCHLMSERNRHGFESVEPAGDFRIFGEQRERKTPQEGFAFS